MGVQTRGVPNFDHEGNFVRLDGLVIDITEQKQMQENIMKIAYYDALTEIPNRRLFSERSSILGTKVE